MDKILILLYIMILVAIFEVTSRLIRRTFETKSTQIIIFKMFVLNCIYCLVYLKYSISLEMISYCFLCNVIHLVTYLDRKYYIIPNKLNSYIFILGIIFWIIKCIIYKQIFIQNILSIFISFLIFISIYILTILIYKKDGIGFGDIKFISAISIYFNIADVLKIIIAAYGVALVITTIQIVYKKKNAISHIAFGPYISIGTFITIMM